jgi:hypothetical protein
MRVLFSALIIEVISLVENVLITPQKWRWINKKIVQNSIETYERFHY